MMKFHIPFLLTYIQLCIGIINNSGLNIPRSHDAGLAPILNTGLKILSYRGLKQSLKELFSI
jgi:hypothetical protein